MQKLKHAFGVNRIKESKLKALSALFHFTFFILPFLAALSYDCAY